MSALADAHRNVLAGVAVSPGGLRGWLPRALCLPRRGGHAAAPEIEKGVSCRCRNGMVTASGRQGVLCSAMGYDSAPRNSLRSVRSSPKKLQL